jgi:hypothetical protein
MTLCSAVVALFRTLPNGESSTGEFAVTMVWQKLHEGWRIVQAHESSVHWRT